MLRPMRWLDSADPENKHRQAQRQDKNGRNQPAALETTVTAAPMAPNAASAGVPAQQRQDRPPELSRPSSPSMSASDRRCDEQGQAGEQPMGDQLGKNNAVKRK